MEKRLNRSFYLRPTLQVAKDLLGKMLVVITKQGKMIGEINEVEAYVGATDLACHAAVGRTRRNEVLFRKGGHAYVYFTYGMYFCVNVVTEREGFGSAVLIRSIIPREGQELMMKNRKILSKSKTLKESELTNGPGKVCQALGLNLQFNGLDLTKDKHFYIADAGKKIAAFKRSTRVGISKAKELEWRFLY